MMEQGIACADCGTAILGSSSSDDPSNRAKCSKCGSSARTIPLNVQDTFAVGQMLKMRQKRLGNSRFIKQIEVGDSLFRSTNEWRKLSRVIDRPNDRYHEVITDSKTGDVIHECDEPLSHHIGHGSQRDQPHSFPEEWVAIAAYYIWEHEGRIHGHDREHWTKAIKQLRRKLARVPYNTE